MGNQPPSASKQKNRLSQQQVLSLSQQFITTNNLCDKTDQAFIIYRLVIAKIYIYGHHHLLQHLSTITDKNKQLQIIREWRNINYENLDLLFQNLIRKKILKVDNDQFTQVHVIEKSINYTAARVEMEEKGKRLLFDGKVALLLFVGCSSTKTQQFFDKEFYKPHPGQPCLFQLILNRLQAIGQSYGMPSCYLFYNQGNFKKVKQHLKGFKFVKNIQTCLMQNQPILNLNGNICLKSQHTGQIIQFPNGSGDFYHSSIKGVSVLQKLKQDGAEYVCCADCENMLEMVIDPYMLGLLQTNQSNYDVMYKCTYPQNQKDKIFRRIVMHNQGPKANTIQGLSAYINAYNKNRASNYQVLRKSPVWMNSLVFKRQRIHEVLQNPTIVSTFPQMINYSMRKVSYWSPQDKRTHQNQICYVFQRQLSDLLINHLFRSQAVMVERQDEYLPVITENKDYSWHLAYQEYGQYVKRKEKGRGLGQNNINGNPFLYYSTTIEPSQIQALGQKDVIEQQEKIIPVFKKAR